MKDYLKFENGITGIFGILLNLLNRINVHHITEHNNVRMYDYR